jgi:phosphoglycerol geranylgeranyltransferase
LIFVFLCLPGSDVVSRQNDLKILAFFLAFIYFEIHFSIPGIMTVFQRLLAVKKKHAAGYWILLDPDKLAIADIPEFLQSAQKAGVDCILVGGSLIIHADFEQFIRETKKHAGNIPVIIFPGGVQQISANADAILFLSLVSGREVQHLIGSQVLAAPLIHRMKLETIATAYMLIDCGKPTAAQIISNTNPLPSDKPEIVVAHALAAQYLGFKLVYLEGGSGAERSVPEEIVTAVTKTVEIPVIVGGGIKTPKEAAAKVKAGASFVVTGNILESSKDKALLKAFSQAIHDHK